MRNSTGVPNNPLGEWIFPMQKTPTTYPII